MERGNVSKIAALAAALVTAASLAVGVTLYGGMATELREREFEHLSNQLSLGAQAFDDRIELMRRQALAISQTPPTLGIVRARDAGGIDPFDGSSQEEWKDRLAHIFTALMRANVDLAHARYIDAAGKEIVRVDRGAAGLARVDEASLQDKGSRDYFKASAALEAGAVHLSDISLNEEFGAIALPEMPVMRFGAPVHGPDGALAGVLVLNVDAHWMFDDFRLVTPQGGDLMIAKPDGAYILHPDPARTFASQRGTDHRFQTDWPEFAAFMRGEAGALPFALLARPDGDLAAVAMVAGGDAAGPAQRRIAVLAVPTVTALAASKALRNRALAVTLGMAIIGAVTAWLVAGRLSRRLNRLRRAAEDVMRKPLDDIDWPDAGLDEVGRVAKAFRTTAALLGDSELALRAERDKLGVVLDGAFNGIVSIDAKGRIEHANRAAFAMFGHASEDMLGRNVAMLMPEAPAAEHDGHIQRLIRDGVEGVIDMPREVTGLRKTGEAFPLRISMTMRHRGDSAVFIGMLEDLTDERRADRMKREFVATVSHELRTPLAAIKGALGLLQGGVMGELPPAMRDLVAMASKNGDRLVRLINDILDIEKIEAGEMAFERGRVDVAALLDDARQENAATAESCGVALRVAPGAAGCDVLADPHRLRQVLANFISNAVKFSSGGDAVVLGAEAMGDRVRIWVSDQGPGVPDTFKDSIFEKFSQADASDARERGGTGLGLSICRAIIDAHDGEIGFDDAPGGGARFHFDLRRMNAAAQPGAAPQALAGRGDVLLFGPPSPDRDRIAAMIEDMGFAAQTTEDAADAGARVQSAPLAAMVVENCGDRAACPDLAAVLDGPCTARGVPVLILSEAQDACGPALTGKTFAVAQRPGPDGAARGLRDLIDRLSGARRPALRILHIEDDADQLDITAHALRDLGQIDWAWTCAEAERMLGEREYDLVILDLSMPDGRPERLLPGIRASNDAVRVVIYSVEEAPPLLRSQVDLTIVKSKLSVSDLRGRISRLFDRGPQRREGDEDAA